MAKNRTSPEGKFLFIRLWAFEHASCRAQEVENTHTHTYTSQQLVNETFITFLTQTDAIPGMG